MKEDERAAGLEERRLRDEFYRAGFSFEEAVKSNTSPANATIDDEVLEKYSALCADVKHLEEEIEKAGERAADLEEKMQSVRSEITKLGCSEQELGSEEPATGKRQDSCEQI